jgi:hypothetical protein
VIHPGDLGDQPQLPVRWGSSNAAGQCRHG